MPSAAGLETFLRKRDRKVLTISESGSRGASAHWYAAGDEQSETAAVEAALAACRAAERDCSLRAVGNFRVEDPR